MIKINNLKAFYGDKEIISADGIRFEDGSITTLVGRNGSGKSTFLKAVSGIIPYGGEILVDENEVKKMQHKERARVLAYLPQQRLSIATDTATLVRHGCFARLRAMRRLTKKDERLCEDAMRMTGVYHLREKHLTEISGGELARAYLAMIIAQETKHIVLDEPEAGIDIEGRVELSSILKSLATQGKCVVLASHDIESAFTLSDKICLVGNGGIIRNGTPDELVNEKSYVRMALGAGLIPVGDGVESYHKYIIGR